MKWMELLFPYRTHLESEVEYLRGQLAQKQRRIDEMQAQLFELASPPREPRRAAPPLHSVKPRGWDAYRATTRKEDEAGSDAGSEVSTIDVGSAAKQAAN